MLIETDRTTGNITDSFNSVEDIFAHFEGKNFVPIADWFLALIWACTEIVNETLNRVFETVATWGCIAITLVCYQSIYKGLGCQTTLIQV